MEIITISYNKPDWRYFWIKSVIGVDLTMHCAKSLVGDYKKNVPQVITEDIVYICGVAFPFKWENNLHIALRSKTGSVVDIFEKGVQIKVLDAERIPITPMQKGDGFMPYGNRKEYYSCRNWQFANQIKGYYAV